MTGTIPNNTVEKWYAVLTPEMIAHIPSFWLQFEPPPWYVHWILGVLYIIIMVIGLLGNSTIIWLFFTTKALRIPRNYLVINLAVSDVLMMHKMVVFIYNSFYLGPELGAFWCQYYGVVGGLSGTSAIMTIAMMALERRMAIANPLKVFEMTSAVSMLMIACIWFYATIFSFTPFFGINRYVPEGYLTSCSFDYLSKKPSSRIFVLVFFFAAYCIPLCIILGCYINIYYTFRKSQDFFQDLTEDQLEQKRKLEMKLVSITLVLIFVWTVSWTPYATIALIGIFTDGHILSPFSSMIPALFCKTASTIDPFIYGFMNQQFYTALRKKISKLFKRNLKRSIKRRRTNHFDISEDEEARVHISITPKAEDTYLDQLPVIQKVDSSDPTLSNKMVFDNFLELNVATTIVELHV